MPAAAVEPVADSPTGSSNGSVKINMGKLSGSPASSSSEITNSSPTVLIVGGGVSGLLSGIALAATGCDVHIFEKEEHILSSEVGLPVPEELQKFLAAYSVPLQVGAETRCFEIKLDTSAFCHNTLGDCVQLGALHSYCVGLPVFVWFTGDPVLVVSRQAGAGRNGRAVAGRHHTAALHQLGHPLQVLLGALCFWL